MRFTARHLAVTPSSAAAAVTARASDSRSVPGTSVRRGTRGGRRRPLLRLAALSALAGLLGSCANGDSEPAQDEDTATEASQSPAEQGTDEDGADGEGTDEEGATDGGADGGTDDDDPGGSEEPDESESPEATEDADDDLLTEQGVTAAHPDAVAAGEEVLEDGGNAVDAAIATALAVSVVEPYASGLGGGGSAVIAGGDVEDPQFYDYREEVAGDGEIPDSGTGVPGFAAGLGELHEAHGSMEWAELVEPARTLASDGVEVTEFLHTRMTEDLGPDAIGDEDEFAPGGNPLDVGDTLVQEDLATTLSTLADEGPESFYTGEVAADLADVDGLDEQTLADYEVRQDEPVRGAFGEHEVLSAAPALPGAALIQMLQDAESAGIAETEPDSPEYVQTLSESWLDAEETAQTELGDPEFVDVPLNDIIGSSTQGSSTQADPARGTPTHGAPAQASIPDASPDDGDTALPDAPNTTHISTVDSSGRAVSMTNTLTNFWGSGDTLGGFFLNNQLSRFDSIDSSANEPEPGKRSVTWSTPSMVLDDEERPVLAIGTPGGHQILNVLGSVLIRWELQGASLEEAIASLRFRLDGESDTLFIEEEPSGELAAGISDAGWSTEVWPRDVAAFGSVQALEIDYEDGTVDGAEDPRREGTFSITE